MCASPRLLVMEVGQGRRLLQIWISALGQLSGLAQPRQKDLFIQILAY